MQAREAEVVELDDELARAPVLERAQQHAARAQAAVRDAPPVAERQRAQRAPANRPAPARPPSQNHVEVSESPILCTYIVFYKTMYM